MKIIETDKKLSRFRIERRLKSSHKSQMTFHIRTIFDLFLHF